MGLSRQSTRLLTGPYSPVWNIRSGSFFTENTHAHSLCTEQLVLTLYLSPVSAHDENHCAFCFSNLIQPVLCFIYLPAVWYLTNLPKHLCSWEVVWYTAARFGVVGHMTRLIIGCCGFSVNLYHKPITFHDHFISNEKKEYVNGPNDADWNI